jgi:hypothetical protein
LPIECLRGYNVGGNIALMRPTDGVQLRQGSRVPDYEDQVWKRQFKPSSPQDAAELFEKAVRLHSRRLLAIARAIVGHRSYFWRDMRCVSTSFDFAAIALRAAASIWPAPLGNSGKGASLGLRSVGMASS